MPHDPGAIPSFLPFSLSVLNPLVPLSLLCASLVRELSVAASRPLLRHPMPPSAEPTLRLQRRRRILARN